MAFDNAIQAAWVNWKYLPDPFLKQDFWKIAASLLLDPAYGAINRADDFLLGEGCSKRVRNAIRAVGQLCQARCKLANYFFRFVRFEFAKIRMTEVRPILSFRAIEALFIPSA